MAIDPYSYGPCMQALTEKRRRFVVAMFDRPLGNQAEWARVAGYSATGGGDRVNGHHAYHDDKVQAAIVEYGKMLFGTEGVVLAVNGMLAIARNVNHPAHAKMLELIANRVGFGEKQQIEVVHRDLTGEALIERVRMLEAKYGLLKDVSREAPALASDGGVSAPRVIEHKADE